MLGARQECSELQRQLEEQRAQHEEDTSDMARITFKVQSLEYDLGNLRQSLQVCLLSVCLSHQSHSSEVF